MSSADMAVKVFRELEPEDFRILMAIELEMSRHSVVPEANIPRLSGLMAKQVKYRLDRLDGIGVIFRRVTSYIGYALSTIGYDCLAINAVVKANVIEAFGKPLGVGKESDVYDALSPKDERIAVKFHRLGRTSFKQTRRLRGYIADRRHISWLYQSRLAAEKEFEALLRGHFHGVSLPKPYTQNRHIIAMEMIDGHELYRIADLSKPESVLFEILKNVKNAYHKAKMIHADLSEFNVILNPNEQVYLIDWPQFVDVDHPNADMLLRRDVQNILRFFRRKYKIDYKLERVIEYVKENTRE